MSATRSAMLALLADIERNAAARERLRIRELIVAMPAVGWAERRFRSHVLAAIAKETADPRTSGTPPAAVPAASAVSSATAVTQESAEGRVTGPSRG